MYSSCQLDLQLTFPRAGVTRKNVEDELRAIDDACVQYAFDVALLGRREIMIEQNYVCGNRGHRSGDFFELALSD
jgi:hypothetical protein